MSLQIFETTDYFVRNTTHKSIGVDDQNFATFYKIYKIK